jgi:hypothetical protein
MLPGVLFLVAAGGAAAVAAASRPSGAPVVGMRTGQRYAVTVLFDPQFLNNVDTPAQAAALFSQSLTAANFVVDPTLTQVVANTDGTWSGKATALYKGGTVVLEKPGGWTLLQVQTA